MRLFSLSILHEIKPLPDVPGLGIAGTLPHKAFYPGRYVLSTSIRGDIRPHPTAPVPRLFDEVPPAHAGRTLQFAHREDPVGWIKRFILAAASVSDSAAPLGAMPGAVQTDLESGAVTSRPAYSHHVAVIPREHGLPNAAVRDRPKRVECLPSLTDTR